MTTASDNVFPKVILDGVTSDPAAPTNDNWKLYAKPDGVYARSSNTIVGPFGSGGSGVSTDTIWDAAGDLVQGTGANTAARLASGDDGTVLTGAGVGSAVAWEYPPGYEFAYAQITADITTTSTSATDATGLTVTYTADGGAVMIEFYTGELRTTGSGGGDTRAIAYIYNTTGAAALTLGITNSGNSGNQGSGLTMRRKHTPAAGSQSYKIQWQTVSAGTATMRASATNPAFIRVTKA